MSDSTNTIETFANQEYKWGFVTDIEAEAIPRGLNEDVVRLISAKKNEPEWLLEWRLKAYRHWLTLKEPDLGQRPLPDDRLPGHHLLLRAEAEEGRAQEPGRGRSGTAQDLREARHPAAGAGDPGRRRGGRGVRQRLGRHHLQGQAERRWASSSARSPKRCRSIRIWSASTSGSVVPSTDNFFAALNSAVFSDGSFCYIPKGVRCPMELSTYFRINAKDTGQFERTLIVADEGAYVSYLEGCTAPMRDNNQLHAAVVELVALDNAQIKYSTVQNWYPGDKEGKGGIYNFVTKRGACRGVNSKISWTQVETGSAITWKYPSCLLIGDNSVGEFYSVALTNNYQQADTGTKMIHIGKNTTSTIVSKGISAGHGQNTYRGGVKILKGATGARNYSQCDSLLLGDKCGAHTFPYLEVKNTSSHGGARSLHFEDRRGPDFLLPAARHLRRGRGLDDRPRILQGSLQELPMEFAVEAQKLLGVSLEGSVG